MDAWLEVNCSTYIVCDSQFSPVQELFTDMLAVFYDILPQFMSDFDQPALTCFEGR